MAAFYEQCLSVHMKIPIFRDDDGDVIKNVVTMATVAMVMIGLRLNNNRAKFQVESIYTSGDIGWDSSRPLLSVNRQKKSD